MLLELVIATAFRAGVSGSSFTQLLAPAGNWSLSVRNDANGSNALPGNRQVDNMLLELIIATALRDEPAAALQALNCLLPTLHPTP